MQHDLSLETKTKNSSRGFRRSATQATRLSAPTFCCRTTSFPGPPLRLRCMALVLIRYVLKLLKFKVKKYYIFQTNGTTRFNDLEISCCFYFYLIQVIIEAVRGQSYRGDIAIDEVGFVKGRCGQQSDKNAKKL